ncbi:MAG: galactose-1-phosphate uridylyltransferase [Bradymonadales bacterium]
MPELRFNVLTNEWVIISPDRAKRPFEFVHKINELPTQKHDPDCPFCPGNERMTEEEMYSMRGEDGKWLTRSVCNKYPALLSNLDPVAEGGIFNTSIPGFGLHEVIIDTPRHDLTLTTLQHTQTVRLINTFKDRYLACTKDPRVKHVIIFKNNGEMAGSSLVHPHSQLIATPIVSNQIDDRMRITRAYHAKHGNCLMCDMIKYEEAEGERIIYANDYFVAFLPYAALSCFHTWIFPRTHAAQFGDIQDKAMPYLAEILQVVIGAQESLLNRPDYNMVFRSSPVDCPEPYYHWYISIIPRLSKTAGFEIGSNIYINGSLPEDNARLLRETIAAKQAQVA